MKKSANLFGQPLGLCVAVMVLAHCNIAPATNLMYADPGWYHAFEGNSAYYYDPDGPNPDYTRSSGPDDNNQPGGRSNLPALINPGPCANDAACTAAAIWQGNASQWDGSAPGATLGGVPTGTPPIPPAAPGGIGAYSEGSTTFIRLQDAGNPQGWGWADKGEQGGPGLPRQEGNNRKLEFKHEMNRDAAFSQRSDILDFGVTLSFRTRIATAATGPLDGIYAEGGCCSAPAWPTDGKGYPVGSNRGIFMITQTGVDGPGQLSFGLLDTNTISGLSNSGQLNKTGLVMNNQSTGTGGPVDTGNATTATLNVEQIPNSQLTDWHEFWITVKRLASPINGNTHEVKVYKDGSLTADVFNVVLASQNEFGSGSNLGLGLTGGTAFGAVDVDFFAYKEGVFAPTLPGLAGDFNNDAKVDAADYVTWRKNNNTNNALPNDNGLGAPVGAAHYNLWRSNFGKPAGAGTSFELTAVPEPSSAILFVLSTALIGFRTRLQSSRAAVLNRRLENK